MSKYIPPGFDRDRVIAGLHLAMGFGEPNRTEDKVTFYLETVEANADAKDQEDVPFDSTKKRPVTKTNKQVACAIEYDEKVIVVNTFGDTQPASVTVTLLGDEYDQIKGFKYLVAGGDQYFYEKTEPPAGLASIDVWTIHCNARDTR